MVALIHGKNFVLYYEAFSHRSPIVGRAEKSVQEDERPALAVNIGLETYGSSWS